MTVQGNFASDESIDPEAFEAFTQYTPLALLWPYARSYTATLGQMLGAVLPPLPTLDAAGPSDSIGSEPGTDPTD